MISVNINVATTCFVITLHNFFSLNKLKKIILTFESSDVLTASVHGVLWSLCLYVAVVW